MCRRLFTYTPMSTLYYQAGNRMLDRHFVMQVESNIIAPKAQPKTSFKKMLVNALEAPRQCLQRGTTSIVKHDFCQTYYRGINRSD
jgi:hypothetical protein